MDIYLFSGTHWDREWYQTFQGFRMRLVRMIDNMLTELETNDSYGVFHFDGQTIVLEDYLEIRPENKERLKKLIENGKIIVGPWYCMPDEMLLSGESLIKNLQKGHKLAREFGGEPLKNGYVCDIFGHIAQMPQIFDKMGIKSAILWRGIGDSDLPMFFDWCSPDGTAVKTVKLERVQGYASFTADVLERQEEKIPHIPDDVLKERLKKHIDSEMKRANLPYLYLSDALDHISVHGDTSKYIKLIQELYPDANVHHVNIMEMFEKLANHDNLPCKNGELYDFSKYGGKTIINTLSSRYNIKAANDKVQTLLEKWVSPLYAFDKVDLPISYLDVANTYLLKNHPHDSICGCSLDRVHDNMLYRFNQSEEISSEIIDVFKNSIRKTDNEAQDIIIDIYNPLPYAYKRNVEVDICFDEKYPCFYKEGMGYEKINSFKLYSADGNELEYGLVNIKTNQVVRLADQNSMTGDVYTITFSADLPAMASVQYTISPVKGSVRYLKRLNSGRNCAENKYISFSINYDGSVNITDKTTGRTYNGLLAPISDSEIGDGWIHVNPVDSSAVTSSTAYIEKIEDNAARIVFKVTQVMRVPNGIDKYASGYHRKDGYTELELVHILTLSEADRYLRVKTIVNNAAKDHRLSITLPTGIANGKHMVNQPFCFVERSNGIDLSKQNNVELPIIERQMAGIVLTSDKDGGFAFVSQYGLHEAGVNDNGTIFVTLLRAFANAYLKNGQPGGQMIGNWEYEYALVPFGADTSFAQLQIIQDELSAGVQSVHYKANTIEKFNSQMLIENSNVVYSTANKTERGTELRFYNPTDTEVKDTVVFDKCIKSAFVTDFEGTTLYECKYTDNKLDLALKPFEIVTVLINF